MAFLRRPSNAGFSLGNCALTRNKARPLLLSSPLIGSTLQDGITDENGPKQATPATVRLVRLAESHKGAESDAWVVFSFNTLGVLLSLLFPSLS